MNYLTVNNVGKSYGDNILFEDIEMHINKGEKVALIARNGTGKSSLLKILAGIEKPEGVNAEVKFHPDIEVSFLNQNPEFKVENTIWETIMELDTREINVLAEYKQSMATGNNNEKMQSLLVKMEELHIWDLESEIEEILSKLNLHESDRKVKHLSGGQKKRLALARILIKDPDFYILDEPTNHLDLSMIEWLQSYLSRPEITLLFITHDRYFLENICDVIYEISNGEMYKYPGNYSDFLEKKAIRKENARKSFQKNKKMLEKEKEWVNRMPKARGTKNKARIDNFKDLKKEVYKYDPDDEMSIEWKPARLGSKILELQYINKSLGGKILVKDLHYKFKKGDRLGIIGPNGSGKTTLLQMINNDLKPDSGKVVHGKTARIGYYKQDNIDLPMDKRVLEVVREVAEVIPLRKGRKLTAKQLCEHFLFFDKKQRVYVSKLSGGERRRLYLLTILMKNPNILILDEPTNDLDIMTLNVLEEYLLSFPGVIIIVSHDRYFMDKIVDHLFVLEGYGYVRNFPGNYTIYREARKNNKLPDPPSHIKKLMEEKKYKNGETSSSPSSSPSSGPTYVQQKEINRLEKKIENLESDKAAVMRTFEDSASMTQDEVQENQTKLEAINQAIEEIEAAWMEKVEEYS